MIQLTKGCCRVIHPSCRCACEVLLSSTVLLVWWGCNSPSVRSLIVWWERSSPWGHLTWASNSSWSAFNFLSSSSWRHSISAMQDWSWQKALLSVVVVGRGLEFSRGDFRLRVHHVLTISAGDHKGSFTAAPWWPPNVLTEIWSELTSRWTFVRGGSTILISCVGLAGILHWRNEAGTYKRDYDA